MKDMRLSVPCLLSVGRYGIVVLARTTPQATKLAREVDPTAKLDYYDLERDGTLVAVFNREPKEG